MMAGEIDPAYLQSLRAGQVLASDGSGRRLPSAKAVAARALAQIADLQRLKEQYRTLVGYPTVAAEALVRLALIEFRFAEREQALEHLALAVTLSRDPHVTYLAHLVTGTIQERQAAPGQAIDAYRAALNLYPRAHSATSLLIARLFQTGARAEAAALAEDLFLEGGPAPDPWRAYRLGDQRLCHDESRDPGSRAERAAIDCRKLADDEQRLDTLEGEAVKKFMLHYNFQPYSTGETKPLRSPGRREIGHGALAERSVARMLPKHEDFPYSTL
jgi:tetratricopeptide (TPR) repeat protein